MINTFLLHPRVESNSSGFRRLVGTDINADTMERELDHMSQFVVSDVFLLSIDGLSAPVRRKGRLPGWKKRLMWPTTLCSKQKRQSRRSTLKRVTSGRKPKVSSCIMKTRVFLRTTGFAAVGKRLNEALTDFPTVEAAIVDATEQLNLIKA
jgi:hypothetical protein